MLPLRFHTEFCSFPVDLFLENPLLYTIIILFNRTCEKKKTPKKGNTFDSLTMIWKYLLWLP